MAFRGASGSAYVLDAFCPHLGANLAVGGTVQGEAIRCPFHHWQFDGAGGKCVAIPYLPAGASIPAEAVVPCRHVREMNGQVLVWHGHAPQARLLIQVYSLARRRLLLRPRPLARPAIDSIGLNLH